MAIMTLKQWLDQFDVSLCIHGRQGEDGYAWYLQQQLGRIPTIDEVKRIGQITRLTTDPITV